MPSPSLLESLRARAGRAVADTAWSAIAQAGRLPNARPERHGVERIADVPYVDTGHAHHTLDVYRPNAKRGPLPVVLYIHGGGFRILSKDTHWLMAIAFARKGYVVFNINYRLAPTHPYPAAVEDACAALVWVMQNAGNFGGDAGRLVIAGESAGANLTTALAVAASWPRPEPWARRVWEVGARPAAAVPACGLLQVTDVDRFARRKRLPAFLHDRLREVEEAYVPAIRPDGDARDLLGSAGMAGAGGPSRAAAPGIFHGGRDGGSPPRRHPPAEGGAQSARGDVRDPVLRGGDPRLPRTRMAAERAGVLAGDVRLPGAARARGDDPRGAGSGAGEVMTGGTPHQYRIWRRSRSRCVGASAL